MAQCSPPTRERWPVVRDGRATPQDEGSQAIVRAVDARADQRILDIAAAPGGKTTGIAEAMRGTNIVLCRLASKALSQIGQPAA